MFNLRPYQRERVSWAIDAFERHRSVLMPMATGTGKTVVFSTIAGRMIGDVGRALILAHRDELIQQAANKAVETGLSVSIEKSDQCGKRLQWGRRSKCVVASVATLKGKRLESWDPNEFDLIVVDEAHHAVADSYRRILRHFRSAKVLGVTATARRTDKRDLGEVFDHTLPEYTITTAIKEGYLVPLVYTKCDTGIDLREIKTSGRKDFSTEDLERLIQPHAESLANIIINEVGTTKTIVFTPDVGSAEAISSAINSILRNHKASASISCYDEEGRKQDIKAFRNNEIQIIVNAMILTEGTDIPPVETIVLLRPTTSPSLPAQMIGRGTRPSPETGKTHCNVVDMGFVTDRTDLFHPVELFASPDHDAEVVARAKKIADETGELAPDIFTQARMQLDQEAATERERIRIEAQRKAVQYRRMRYDPLQVQRGLLPPEVGGGDGPASEPQIALLKKWKIPGAESFSKKRACDTIGQLLRRQKLGLASYAQVNTLVRNGMTYEQAASITFDEARAALDVISQKWRH